MVRQLIASRQMLRLSLIGIVLVAVVGAVLDLRDPERGPYDFHWERIQSQGFLVVGTDPTLPPFSIHTEDGPIGLEPDIAREIGQRLGLEVRFLLLGYDGTYDSLLNPPNGTDMVISTLRPDPFRMGWVRYTTPYFDAGHVLVSLENDQTLAELQGKTLAVEFASEGDIAARRVENLKIQRYFTAEEAMDAVLEGEADAALVDRVSAFQYTAHHQNLGLAAQTSVPDPYAIAIRRSDWRLHRAVDNALLAMQVDGTLDTLIQKWVASPPTVP